MEPEHRLGRPFYAVKSKFRLILIEQQYRGFRCRHGFYDAVQNCLQKLMEVQALGHHGTDGQIGVEVPGLFLEFPAVQEAADGVA